MDDPARWSSLEGVFHKALELNGKYYDALTGLGWVLQEQADLLTDNVKYQDAITSMQKSLDIRDAQPYARVALGWSYYGQKQYDQAEEEFQRGKKHLRRAVERGDTEPRTNQLDLVVLR